MGSHATAARVSNDTAPVTVTKRDGSEVPFDSSKIVRAVRLCLTNNCHYDSEKADDVARTISAKVIFDVKDVPRTTVEHVQDAVEKALMAAGLHNEAREYILYREQRRKERVGRPSDPEAAGLLRETAKYFTGVNGHLQQVQAFDKFARFHEDLGRREVWPETVGRLMRYVKGHTDSVAPGAVDADTWRELELGILNLEAAPSMRLVQMSGPALERCQVGVYNCAFLFMDSPRALAEDLYCLMQGTGVGFSVEYRHAVDKWPRVKKQRGSAPDRYAVPDTTEGWCEAVREGAERWLEGGDYDFDFSGVRPEGARLRTKGGRASGPAPLRDALAFIREKILSRQGQRLTSLDVHDMTCMVHRIGQMGGVRRASGISFSDLDDPDMRDCKAGAFWSTNPQRNQANNSAVYEERPSAVEFMEEWLSLAKSGTGERGIFNAGSLKHQLPKRRKRGVLRANPCGEIYLRNKQFCNLSIAVARVGLALAELFRRVRLATIWGTIQSTMTRFNYLSDEWRKNCEEERLLGVDVLGHLDCELTRPGAPGRDELLAKLRQYVIEVNAEWAARLGVNPSAAATCNKPSGDSSCFFDTAAGFKAHHGRHYLRRIRLSRTNPVAKVLKASGVPWAEDYDRSGLEVYDFPCKAPEGAVVLGDQTALEQLENWRSWKKHYTEHNPSCFSGETKFITPGGLARFDEFTDGDPVTALGSDGKWVRARVRSHGVQPLWGVTLARGGCVKEFYATAEHLWPRGPYVGQPYKDLSKFGPNPLIRTDRLPVCDDPARRERIPSVSLRGKPSHGAWSVCHGIAYGLRATEGPDGFLEVVLDDDPTTTDKRLLAKHFEEIGLRPRDRDGRLVVGGLSPEWRHFPGRENNSYTRGFLAGWLAVCGRRTHRAQWCLDSVRREELEWAASVAPGAGVDTAVAPESLRRWHSLKLFLRMDDADMLVHPADSAAFKGTFQPDAGPWSVVDAQPLGESAPVWCLEVPGDHLFALEGGVLTHNCTVYVKPEEWLEVGNWVYANWDDVGGLSFSEFSGGSYPLAPYETISEAEYERRRAAFPEIDWSKLLRYELDDQTDLHRQYACTGGSCEI